MDGLHLSPVSTHGMHSTLVTDASSQARSPVALRGARPLYEKASIHDITMDDVGGKNAVWTSEPSQGGPNNSSRGLKQMCSNSSAMGDEVGSLIMTQDNDQGLAGPRSNAIGNASLHSQSPARFTNNRERFELPTLIPSSQRRDRPLWEGPVNLRPARLHCSSHVGRTTTKNPMEADEVWPTILQRSRASAVEVPANASVKSASKRKESSRWECNKCSPEDTKQLPRSCAKRQRLEARSSESPESLDSSWSAENQQDNALCLPSTPTDFIARSNLAAKKQSRSDERLQSLRKRVRKSKNTARTMKPGVTKSMRGTAIQRLTETLSETTKKLATEIESEYHQRYGKDRRTYRDQMRSLLFNVRMDRNPELNEALTNSKLSPSQLAQMSSADMASYKMRERLGEAESERIHASDQEFAAINHKQSDARANDVSIQHESFEVALDVAAKAGLEKEFENGFRKEREYEVEEPVAMKGKTGISRGSTENGAVEGLSSAKQVGSWSGRTFGHIWTGSVRYPQSSGFEAVGNYLSGPTSALALVPSKAEIRGSTDLTETLEYFHQLQSSPLWTVVMFAVMPKSRDDESAYWQLCEFLNYRQRAGVVARETNIRVYVIPPGRPAQRLHEAGGEWLIAVAVVKTNLLRVGNVSFVSCSPHQEYHPTATMDKIPCAADSSLMALHSEHRPQWVDEAANLQGMREVAVHPNGDMKSQPLIEASSLAQHAATSCNCQCNMECSKPVRLQQSACTEEYDVSQKHASSLRRNRYQSRTSGRDVYGRDFLGRYHRGGYSSSF